MAGSANHTDKEKPLSVNEEQYQDGYNTTSAWYAGRQQAINENRNFANTFEAYFPLVICALMFVFYIANYKRHQLRMKVFLDESLELTKKQTIILEEISKKIR